MKRTYFILSLIILSAVLHAQYLQDDFTDLSNWSINNENEAVVGTPAKTIHPDSTHWYPGAILFDYIQDLYGDTSSSFNGIQDFIRPNPEFPGTDLFGNPLNAYTTSFNVYKFTLNDNSVIDVVNDEIDIEGKVHFLSYPDSLVSYTDTIDGLIDYNDYYEVSDGVMDDKKVITQIGSNSLNNNILNYITDNNFGNSIYFDGARSIKELWSSGDTPSGQLDYEFGPSVQYQNKLEDNFYTVTLNNAINVDNENQTLSFDSYGFARNDSCTVELSTDNGVTWNIIWYNERSLSNPYTSVDRIIILLNSFINVGDNYIIRFRYNNNYTTGIQEAGMWLVDNVSIFIDVDGDGYGGIEDCDETDASINSGIEEVLYDGKDNDCNPLTLDYQDNDNDGYNSDIDCDDENDAINPGISEIPYDGLDNDCNPLTLDDDLDQDGFTVQYDCDDNNPLINSNASEILYDGIDNDCNPLTLDDDLDQDGFNSDVDCNDNNPNVNPNATEILYDGINNDCDDTTPDGEDGDLDGYNSDVDCDDANANINPGATEILYDGIDNDCNPITKDDDFDEDGYNVDVDCDDQNSFINPGQIEIPYDGKDNDCNPLTLDDDLDQDGYNANEDCDDNDPNRNPGNVEILNDGIDNDCDPNTSDKDLDGDGYGADVDCDDFNFGINPGYPEIPYDGIDNDCNPLTPDDDIDGDGFDLAVDCDDNNPQIFPSNQETAYDGIDNDCNSLTPDDDIDQDGYILAEDCDDNNYYIHPGNAEITYDGFDNDCNPSTLDNDLDQDGYDLIDDCDDLNADLNPGMEEIMFDDIDNDCDPSTLDDWPLNITEQNIGQIKAFPNPVRTELNIHFENIGAYDIYIYNLSGSLLESFKFEFTDKVKLNLYDYPNGVYFIMIQNENQLGHLFIQKYE